jgi:hypothetical protein
MIDGNIAILGALRDTILTIPEITNIVVDQVYWEDVEDNTALPYVIIAKMLGGYENTTQAQAMDTYWKICMVTADKTSALAGTQAIAKLHLMALDVTNEPYLYPYGGILKYSDVYEKDFEQNVKVYKVGGIFRIRAIINECDE